MIMLEYNKKYMWHESQSELYGLSDSCLSVKLVPTFADRGCHVVNVMDQYSHDLGFLDQSRYFFFQVAPKLCSRD
jgi:CBS-domain-containing membrane protein